MAFWFWDASALAKRHAAEVGSDTADTLFRTVPRSSMGLATLGYAETYAILLRRRNGGLISLGSFLAASDLLVGEVVDDLDFALLHPSEQIVVDSIELIQRHNLNSTDATLLALLLNYASSPDAGVCVMIASDKRLLRATVPEGLTTFNPEEVRPEDVASIVAST